MKPTPPPSPIPAPQKKDEESERERERKGKRPNEALTTTAPFPVPDSHVIAVDPKYQGRKAGALIVQWGLNLGESAGLPVYFESSPSTVGLYKKMGFEILEEQIVHEASLLGTDEDVVVPLMVKMPSAAKGLSFKEWRETGYPSFDTIPAASK